MSRLAALPITLIFILFLILVFSVFWTKLENKEPPLKSPKDEISANACRELHLLKEKIANLDESYGNSPADYRYKLAGMRTRYHRTKRFLEREYPNVECPQQK